MNMPLLKMFPAWVANVRENMNDFAVIGELEC